MDKQYWLAGQYNKKFMCGPSWELIGLFSTEHLAVQACTEKNHFVAQVELNKRTKKKQSVFANSYYPLIENKKDG